MKTFEITDDRPTPLLISDNFIKRFLSAVGDPDEKIQAALAKKMGFGFLQGIGKLIYAMVTCRPDIAFAVVKLAQFSACPSETHYHAVRHCLKYLRKTKADGIHFCRTHPCEDLEATPLPTIRSNAADLENVTYPQHDVDQLFGYVDSDFATCPLT